MKNLVTLEPDKFNPNTGALYPLVLDAAQAIEQRVLRIQPIPAPDVEEEAKDEEAKDNEDKDEEAKDDEAKGDEARDEKAKDVALQAPNITLNVPGTFIKPLHLWAWTLVGVLLQMFMLAFPALATYHWKWQRKGVAVHKYAYALFVSGTIAIMIGLLGCGHVVEGSTTEHTFEPSEGAQVKIRSILRLQMECVVGSQQFQSFIILNDLEDMIIRASRLDSWKSEKFK